MNLYESNSTSAALVDVIAETMQAVEAVTHAAVWLTDVMLVTSDEIASELHAAQLDAGQGPTWAAIETGEIRRLNYLSDKQWPIIGDAFADKHVCSAGAFPIRQGASNLGVLTLYSPDHAAFGAAEMRIGRSAAEAIAAIAASVAP